MHQPLLCLWGANAAKPDGAGYGSTDQIITKDKMVVGRPLLGFGGKPSVPQLFLLNP